jgi:hypothetical protein
MGWDLKVRGGRYYYRSRKVNGRVVKEYVGKGPAAELTALLDRRRRQERREARLALLQERAALAHVDLLLREASELTNALAAAALLLSGWHEHRGSWRRRREQATQA